MNQIALGCVAEDIVTGFRGRVTGRVSYLSGCDQALVVPRVKPDGELIGAQWFDVQRLRVEEGSETIQLINGDTPGAGIPAPVR